MPTTLLNDDGTASMATMLMTSHHAFRRDLACFGAALTDFDPARSAALAEEWTAFRTGLHHHHTIEDTAMFPDLRGKHPELATAIDELDAHHRAIDPLLVRGDEVFARLPDQRAAAREVVGALADLLATHLDAEERAIIPHLRDAKDFPVPPGDLDLMAMYADGFAWSIAGLAPSVCDRIFAMLPAALVERIPAARERFDERSRRVWGRVHTGRSVTSVPG